MAETWGRWMARGSDADRWLVRSIEGIYQCCVTLPLRTEQEAVERRRHERRHVVVMGRIDTGSPHLTSCIVRDLTATGARLMVTDAEALPEHVRLILQPSGYVTRAHIVWRGEGSCGVEFLPDP